MNDADLQESSRRSVSQMQGRSIDWSGKPLVGGQAQIQLETAMAAALIVHNSLNEDDDEVNLYLRTQDLLEHCI
jgi:hypothetical protein